MQVSEKEFTEVVVKVNMLWDGMKFIAGALALQIITTIWGVMKGNGGRTLRRDDYEMMKSVFQECSKNGKKGR